MNQGKIELDLENIDRVNGSSIEKTDKHNGKKEKKADHTSLPEGWDPIHMTFDVEIADEELIGEESRKNLANQFKNLSKDQKNLTSKKMEQKLSR